MCILVYVCKCIYIYKMIEVYVYICVCVFIYMYQCICKFLANRLLEFYIIFVWITMIPGFRNEIDLCYNLMSICKNLLLVFVEREVIV